MTAAYDFGPEARVDLREIVDFIADDNPAAADWMLTEILGRLALLARFPQQGHRRTDLISHPPRFSWVRKYLIAYAPDEQPLWVMPLCMAIAARALWRRFFAAEKTTHAGTNTQSTVCE